MCDGACDSYVDRLKSGTANMQPQGWESSDSRELSGCSGYTIKLRLERILTSVTRAVADDLPECRHWPGA